MKNKSPSHSSLPTHHHSFLNINFYSMLPEKLQAYTNNTYIFPFFYTNNSIIHILLCCFFPYNMSSSTAHIHYIHIDPPHSFYLLNGFPWFMCTIFFCSTWWTLRFSSSSVSNNNDRVNILNLSLYPCVFLIG